MAAVTGADFEKFRSENPAVERVLIDLCNQINARGLVKVGFDLLWSQVRWFFVIATAPGDTEYKLNDHLRPFWARMLMSEHAEFTQMFDTRKAVEADDWAYAKYGIKYGYLLRDEEEAA